MAPLQSSDAETDEDGLGDTVVGGRLAGLG
jgi:hypothetical protein